MSEKLRLEAEFRDKGVSSGLKKIGGELALIKKTPGMTEAHKWLGEFNERANGFVKEGGGVKSVMTGIGIGGLTAATSVAELVKSFSELAARTADLKEVSRQTGLTVDEVNRLQRAGEKLYIDPSKMSAGLESLSGKMFDFRRHMGELYGELSQFDPDFARKLSLEKPQEQIRDIFAWLSKIKDPQLQRRWTEAFMGDGDLARLLTNGGRDFADAMREAAEHTASITPDMQEKAKLLHDSILEFQHGWEDFQTNVGPAVFGNLTRAMHEFQGVFEQIKSIYDFIQAAKDHPVQSAGQAVLGAIDRNARENQNQEDRATRAGGPNEKIIFDLPSLVSRGIHGLIDAKPGPGDAETKVEDANALHKSDVAPLDWIAKQKALERAARPVDAEPKTKDDGNKSLWGRLFHRSAFVEGEGGDGGGLGFGGATEMIADGTKQGVLAAFREMMAQNDADRDARKGGVQNAAFETWDDDRLGRSNGYGLKSLGTPNRGGHDSSTHAGTSQEVVDYIREAAAKRHIDPEVAVAVANSEGLKGYDPNDGTPDRGGDQGTSFSPWQLHYKNNIPGLSNPGMGDDYTAATGHHASDKRFWKEQTDFALDQAAKNGWSPWHGAANSGIGNREGIGTYFGPKPSAAVGASVPGHIGGQLKIGDESFRFGSGGQGHSSIPFGDYPITPGAIGPWGRAHGTLGVNNNAIYDQALKRMRTGIELHAGHSAELFTEGCVAFEAQQWPKVKSKVLGMIKKEGQAYLHVDKDGASITPSRSLAPDQDDKPRRSLNLPEVARKSGTTEQTIRHEGGAAVDINLRSDGTVRSTRAKSHGLVTAVNLSRGPTMMLPSGTA